MKQEYAIAVDLGASNVRVALVSRNGKILQRESEPTNKHGKNGMAITNQLVRLITNLAGQTNHARPKGISIASIGPLDYHKGGPIHSPNIPFSFVPLAKPLQKKFSIPVLLNNDTNAAVLGEKRFGAGKKARNLVYITISSGIGGGAIVDGRLLLGKSGNAAEIGHLIVDTTYNLMCGCKKGAGHWESLASGTNIPRFFQSWLQRNTKKLNPLPANAAEVFNQAGKENQTALAFLDELAKVNARAISSVIVAYDPELITIGGSVALNNQRVIIQGIKKYVDHYLKLPQIQITKLGEDIILLGAAAALFQKEEG